MNTTLRVAGALAAGTVAGLALSAAVGYLWLCFGSAPHTDGLISI